MIPAIMARRAAANPTITARATASTGTVGTNPALRAVKVKAPVGAVRNRKAGKLTPLQRDSTGRSSHWSRSANYFDAVEIDTRWGK